MDKLLENDLETFGTLCKEMTETLGESNEKLHTIKERLEKLNSENPVRASNPNNFQYIDVKSMLLLNYCMSLQYYMLKKAEGAEVAQHEIFERLAYLRLMIEKLKPLDKKVEYQIDKLLRAAVTQTQGIDVLPNRQKKEDNLRYKPNLGNFDTKHVTDKPDGQTPTMDEESEEDEGEGEDEDVAPKPAGDDDSEDIDPDEINSDDIDSEELEKYTVAKQKAQAKVHKEDKAPETYKAVKFNPVSMVDKKSKSEKQRARDQKRMTRVDLVRELKHDLLGMPEEVHYGIASGNRKLVEEEQADEKLEMEYYKRISYTKKELKEKEKRRKNLERSDYTGITDGFQDFQRIQEFMGKRYSDDEDEQMQKQMEKQKFLDEHRNKKRDKKGKAKFEDEEIDSDEAGSDIAFNSLPKRGKIEFVGLVLRVWIDFRKKMVLIRWYRKHAEV